MTRSFLIVLTLSLGACGHRYKIPSSAMVPTLLIGDHISARGLGDGEPRRGDVVVFEYHAKEMVTPALETVAAGGRDVSDGQDFVKRVIGLPGDRVRLEGDTVVLNGKPIATERLGPSSCGIFGRDDDATPVTQCPCEQQRETIGGKSWVTQHYTEDCAGKYMLVRTSPTWPLREAPHLIESYLGAASVNPSWPDVVVPDGTVLVLGDNRDSSKDSRYTGFVPIARIKHVVTEVVSNDHDDARSGLTLE